MFLHESLQFVWVISPCPIAQRSCSEHWNIDLHGVGCRDLVDIRESETDAKILCCDIQHHLGFGFGFGMRREASAALAYKVNRKYTE